MYSNSIGRSFRNLNKIRPYNGKIKTIILDNSGTFIDPYVIAPVKAFQETFKKFKINISSDECRKPMGIRKDLHICEILKNTRVKDEWNKIYGRNYDKNDIQNIYNELIPTQIEILHNYCNLLPKVPETIEMIKNMNIKIGTTTGFNRKMMDIILNNMNKKNIHFDFTVAGDDFNSNEIHLGTRPLPFMIYKNLFNLNSTPIESVIKIDDTIPGIQEGLNAGCWTIAIADYSNYMNINSMEEWNSMSSKEQMERKIFSRNKLHLESGCHYVIHEFDDIIYVIDDINNRLSNNEKP